jgi:hypothetical protein
MIALLCLVFTVIAEPSRSLRGVAGGEDPLPELTPEVFVQEDHNDSQDKMFFWPIWTKSAMPLPQDLEGEGNDNDNKMFFWPIWTKSAMPLPKDLEGEGNDNKMFFWPIWTARSNDFQVSEKPLVKETPKPSSASVADGVQSELEDHTPTDGAPADGEQADNDAKMWFWY